MQGASFVWDRPENVEFCEVVYTIVLNGRTYDNIDLKSILYDQSLCLENRISVRANIHGISSDEAIITHQIPPPPCM